MTDEKDGDDGPIDHANKGHSDLWKMRDKWDEQESRRYKVKKSSSDLHVLRVFVPLDRWYTN